MEQTPMQEWSDSTWPQGMDTDHWYVIIPTQRLTMLGFMLAFCSIPADYKGLLN